MRAVNPKISLARARRRKRERTAGESDDLLGAIFVFGFVVIFAMISVLAFT
jgi:hypothetical protein